MKALTAIEFPYLNLKDKFNYLIHLGFLKRVTFSEYLTERCEELAENDNELDIQEFGMINNDFDMLFSGYARQPFRPEMITQLFEGWLYNPITELFEALNDKMYD